MKALAIDPGERTGWAIGNCSPGGLVVTERGVDSLRDFAMKLENLIDDVDVVIYETWRLYRSKARKLVGNDMQTSQLVGIIRYVCWQHPSIKLVSQGANIKSTAMKTMPEDIKESLDSSTEQHDQDAVMHLWYWYWDTHVQPPDG